MDALADFLIYVATVVIWLFTLGYGFFAPWWRSPMGRNVMAMSITHALIFGLIVSNTTFGVSWAGRPIVRVLIYGSIAAIFTWRGVILLHEQILVRRDDQEESASDRV